jgi:hypothetical protein
MILFSQAAQSQSITVTGTVSDDIEPLPGVSIEVKGTNIFTVTGVDGEFSINVPDNSVLVFTFVGFETKEVVVGDNRVFDIMLTPPIPKKYSRFYVGVSAGASGFGTIGLDYPKGVSQVYGVEAAYFFNKKLGLGLKFNYSRRNTDTPDTDTQYAYLIRKDKVGFLGPAVYGRFDSNSFIFIVCAGFGWLHWQYRELMDYSYYHAYKHAYNGSSIGGFISVGGNYMLTRNLGVGLNIQSTVGSIKGKERHYGGYYYIDTNVRNPTAIGCTIGINYSF